MKIKHKTYKLGHNGVERFSWVFLSVASLVFLFPMFLAVMVSLSSQESIRLNGYQVIPSEFSIEAYEILLTKYGPSLIRSVALTVGTGLLQPILSIILIVCMAYPLSQPDFAGRNFWRKYILVTMLFSGGLIPTYILYTKYLGLRNNIMIYLLPTLAAWDVFLFRTFFVGIDRSMIESAKLDGASNFQTLRLIMLPLTKPLVAMNFFNGFLGRWNNITTPLYYITEKKLYTVQYLLQKMLNDAKMVETLLSLGFSVDESAAAIPVESIRFALAVVGALPVLLIFPFIQKYYAKGVTMGSTKG